MYHTKKIFLSFTLILFIGGIIFSSCKKNENFENVVVSQTTQDNSASEEQFDDAHSTANDVASNAAFSASLSRTDDASQVTGNYGCATVTIIANPAGGIGKQMTIDFGTTGCVVNSESGKTKKGQIIVTTTGPYYASGTVVTTTFNNYYVNDVKVEGRHVVTNTTGGSTPVFSVVVSDAKLTFADGTTRSWSATRTRTWVSGFGDGNLFNDVIEITGGSSGVNRRGDSYISLITTKLTVKTECWKSRIFKPVSGVITVTVGTNIGTIDYGSGSCDNSFVITINGRTYNISRS